MPASGSLPGKQILLSIALAGLIGEIAFEIYAWVLSPILFGMTLQPANLVIMITEKLAGIQLSNTLAFAIHFTIGVFFFSIIVYLVRLIMPSKVWLTGLSSGLVLWFIAQGVLAPFIGRSFMMDFGPYTQSSFIGHVGMTLIMAHLLALFMSRFNPSPSGAFPRKFARESSAPTAVPKAAERLDKMAERLDIASS